MIGLAWRNIWRQARRSLITVSAMAFGAAICMPMMAFMEGMFATMFDVAVTQQTGHVRVEHPEYPVTNSMFDTMPNAGSTLAALEGLPPASAFADTRTQFCLSECSATTCDFPVCAKCTQCANTTFSMWIIAL